MRQRTKAEYIGAFDQAVKHHREQLDAAQKYGREQYERAEALEERLAVHEDEYRRAELLDELVSMFEQHFRPLEMSPDEFATIQEARKFGGAGALRRKEESA